MSEDVILKRLIKIFNEKKWPIVPENQIGYKKNLFDNYFNLLLQCDSAQQDLLLSLTEDFNVYDDFKYFPMVERLLEELSKAIYDSQKFHSQLVFVTVKALHPEKRQRTGSGDWMLAGIRSVLEARSDLRELMNNPEYLELNDHKFIRKKVIKGLLKDFSLVYVDDFIGSGDTIIELNNWLIPRIRHEVNIDIYAMLLVGMEKGINRIKQVIPNTFVRKTHVRGLSDNSRIEDKEQAKNIMLSLEEGLLFNSFERTMYSLGYNQDEALIRMIRTPDNTFPVFWRDKKSDGENWPAPFGREL